VAYRWVLPLEVLGWKLTAERDWLMISR
jgi:hypothetical protein